ncbi:phosphotransferase [Pseudoalteromonas rhizosphaerae]|uniref:phosphotransferase n=2 Tax=Pseudoalteromonas TaxID=53246 RepID=UPI0037047A29
MNDFLYKHLKAPCHINEISGGANSRVFNVRDSENEYIFKQFFTKNNDYKAKCEREFSFLKALTQYKKNNTATPIACDIELGYLLMSKLPGEKVTQPTEQNIKSAFSFIVNCNSQQQQLQIINAKDAVKKLADFELLVTNRFSIIQKQEVISSAFLSLVENKIMPFFYKVQKDNRQLNGQMSLDCNYLSPSDFGFHNILIDHNELYFYDFEYAGIDSLWKLTADFFSQPQIPVPIDKISIIKELPLFGFLTKNKREFISAFQMTRIKWCFIIGNVFISEIYKRREFADKAHILDEENTIAKIECYLIETHFQTKILEDIL